MKCKTAPVLDRIISVCCARDLPTARIGIKQMLKYQSFKQYIYAVPSSDIHVFKDAMPASIEVVDERELSEGWDIRKITSALPKQLGWRAGWYLQQFIKINAARLGGTTLIWDADTVLLRNLEIGDPNRKIFLYSGTENHHPYFKTIEKILGLTKKSSRSFIAQCMPVKSIWANSMIEVIERRCNRPWIEAILAEIPGGHPCEFSEYETIGTFVAHHYPEEAQFNNIQWSRFGTRIIDGPERLTNLKELYLSRIYNFIAFEATQKSDSLLSKKFELARTAWHQIKNISESQTPKSVV